MGVYIHVPFCKTRCHYCDFYKSTDAALIDAYLHALGQEMQLRASEFEGQVVETVYFGGGTPTQLSVAQIEDLMLALGQHFAILPDAEITLECNPDDLSLEYIEALAHSSVNRLSIGTQSFRDDDLKMMNRRHSAEQAVGAVRQAQAHGFRNISIDLIYGLPNLSLESWAENIEQALSLDVPHISAYHLTYHEGTLLYKRLQEQQIQEISDELSLAQFQMLREKMTAAGFEHYEISNFAKEGNYSRHNRGYWERKPYLGMGPSAHSFDLHTRRWNCSSVEEYISALAHGEPYFEVEQLSSQDQYNDYIITTLRTQWGINDDYLKQHFEPHFVAHFQQQVQRYLRCGQMIFNGTSYVLNTEGLFLSDAIMEDLCFF